MRHVYFLVLPNAHILDLAGPLQIVYTLIELGLADVKVECIGPVSALRFFQNAALSDVGPLPTRLRPGAVVFVIGSKLHSGLTNSRPWRDAAEWLSAHAANGDHGLQVCGVCSGAFLLAASGLLDGRLCTTHHRLVPQLRKMRPAAHVIENRVFVRDHHVWTSAGVASGIDLALRMIAEAFGEDVAIQVSRENVSHFRSFGGDPEISASLRYRAHCNVLIHTVQDMISRDLSERLNYEQLAKSVGCSGRHLARIFVAETGTTIKRFQIDLRMDRARQMLVGSNLSLDDVAEKSGFASVQAFRANWNRLESSPPSSFRERHLRKSSNR